MLHTHNNMWQRTRDVSMYRVSTIAFEVYNIAATILMRWDFKKDLNEKLVYKGGGALTVNQKWDERQYGATMARSAAACTLH